ncbi:MAG: hypothetical protein JO337_13345 [Acidimicrobiales bacterium]|nr:hypothetical protein [Acidimicrobiales bacterium]
MTSATCPCPRTASILVAPLTLGTLLINLTGWGQQAWIEHQYAAAMSSVLYCAALALGGPAAMACTIIRRPRDPTSRWRQLLRIEERTLIASVPAFLLLLVAAAAAAVI